MIDYRSFFEYLHNTKLREFGVKLQDRTEEICSGISHGDFEKWQRNLDALPDIHPSIVELDKDTVSLGREEDLNCSQEDVEVLLKSFHPWRKGPFEIFGVHIDSEWRSDFKWERVKNNIVDLNDKCVLDIGCGNGYHCFRMAGCGAKAVVGIDPFLLYVMQFRVLNKYAKLRNISVLPVGIEHLPKSDGCFDAVFSMGVLYHRRDNYEHLRDIYNLLDTGGQAVIETLVLDRGDIDVLEPEGRYAKMRNVFSIPSVSLLKEWLSESGFSNIRVVDVSKTTSEEQRKTGWMVFESLEDFLDSADECKTIEGYPAPVRAVAVAEKRI